MQGRMQSCGCAAAPPRARHLALHRTRPRPQVLAAIDKLNSEDPRKLKVSSSRCSAAQWDLCHRRVPQIFLARPPEAATRGAACCSDRGTHPVNHCASARASGAAEHSRGWREMGTALSRASTTQVDGQEQPYELVYSRWLSEWVQKLTADGKCVSIRGVWGTGHANAKGSGWRGCSGLALITPCCTLPGPAARAARPSRRRCSSWRGGSTSSAGPRPAAPTQKCALPRSLTSLSGAALQQR